MNEEKQAGPPFLFHRHTYAEVDLNRIRDNFLSIRDSIPQGAFLCPMVKANAYGHGDVEVSRQLRAAGAAHLGVGLIEEGIGLRLSGDQGSLLLFGLFDASSADTVLEFDLTPVVSDWNQLASLEAAARRAAREFLTIHFKFNTGMNRLGFDLAQAAPLRVWLSQHPLFRLAGVCTHLLRGDDAGNPEGESESQLRAFADAYAHFADLRPEPHVLNSSATANLWSRVHEKRVLDSGSRAVISTRPLGSRPGLSIYGLQPSNDEGAQIGVLPVLSFKSHLVMIHRVEVGERVSYNAIWRAARPSWIGVVPVGYADGYFRLLSNRGPVLFRGQRAQVAGQVCMDYFMIDLTDIVTAPGEKNPEAGEEVVLIGRQSGNATEANAQEISASELADLVGTISYEILTHISERVPRVYRR